MEASCCLHIRYNLELHREEICPFVWLEQDWQNQEWYLFILYMVNSCCSITKLCPAVCNPMDAACRTFLSLASLCPGVCPSSFPLNQWCHLTISSSVTLFSFCLQHFPASFPMNWHLVSGGQSVGASASASIFPMSI